MNDQKNLLIAIVASILIMVTFQYFWERPKIEAERARQQQAAETQPTGAAPSGAPQGTPGQAATPSKAPQTPPARAPAPAGPDAKLPSAPQQTPDGAPAQAVPPGGPATPATRVEIKGPRVTLDSAHLSGSISLK
ncbi:MAG TPA: hypothetical protein VLN73_00345, partial [Alphaproteobacteria bacterium]|nr:hypothetical protein [Alphaproteobacteria bacterium]